MKIGIFWVFLVCCHAHTSDRSSESPGIQVSTECADCCDEDEISEAIDTWNIAVHHLVRGASGSIEEITSIAELLFVDTAAADTLTWELGPGWRQSIEELQAQNSEEIGGSLSYSVEDYIEFVENSMQVGEDMSDAITVYHEADMAYHVVIDCNSATAEGMYTEVSITSDDEEIILYHYRIVNLVREGLTWKITSMEAEVY